jgi:hypothetical protein
MTFDILNAQAGAYDGRIWSIAGDSYGVLHTFDPSPPGDLLSMPSHVLQHSWTRDYRLDSQVCSEPFPTNKVKWLPFVLSVAYRYLLFVPQAPNGCEPFYLCRIASIERLNGAQSDFIWLKYTGA